MRQQRGEMHENIRVATLFEAGGQIRPVWFELRRRRYQVDAVTYRWRGQHGAATLLYFAVATEGGLFELAYDTAAQSWALTGIEAA